MQELKDNIHKKKKLLFQDKFVVYQETFSEGARLA